MLIYQRVYIPSMPIAIIQQLETAVHSGNSERRGRWGLGEFHNPKGIPKTSDCQETSGLIHHNVGPPNVM